MNPRRHPRTMREAFGPYTSHDLHPMRDDRDYSAAWYAWMFAIATVAAVLIWITL
jgi:hypothetical protein